MEEKILDKIRKLFALAENNPNENESESAMRQAKKMLDRHNLSMYQLIEKDSIGIKIEDNVNMPWVRIIYRNIGNLYDADYITSKDQYGTQHLLIGTESNRVTASIVISFVIDKIRRTSVGKGNGFRNAAAFGIQEQVVEILEARMNNKEEVIPGTGLVAVDASEMMKEDIDNWID